MPRATTIADPAVPAVRTTGPLIRQTAVELVVAELRTRILSGDLAPGSALRQEALADELGVSRIPLREAMRLLSSEGLVDMRPHRGAYVSMLSLAEVREFFDLRLRLEPWLFQEAASRIDTADLDRAEAIVKQMNNSIAGEWGQLNWQLHELLYRAADRPLALNIVRALHEKSERYLRFQVVNASIRRLARDEHLALIDLCRKRRVAKAGALMEEHIADAATHVLAIVGRLLIEAKLDHGT